MQVQNRSARFGTFFFITAMSFVGASQVQAHGYMTNPASRSFKCSQGQNGDCGSIRYEPQSVEAPKGFPAAGPADGKIASGGVRPDFSPLDRQTSDLWSKTTIKSGINNFAWKFTANHKTSKWEYYITRQGWDQNHVLTRSAFEPTPFCTVDGRNQQPPATVTHQCSVPAGHTGYHVILGVWEIADTVNSFYQVNDVLIEGGSTTPPPSQALTQVGSINSTVVLKAGDSVRTRVFDASGENDALRTDLAITRDEDGAPSKWSYLLAQKINETQPRLAAGQLDANGNVVPAYGLNTIYSKAKKDIVRVELDYQQANVPVEPVLHVHDLAAEYPIVNGKATLRFSVMTEALLAVSAKVFDADNRSVGFATADVTSSHAFAVDIQNAVAGSYTLVIQGVNKAGETVQRTETFSLKGDATYQYRFPENISLYKAGTRVLQPKNGKVYECKPYPYSGFCKQWTAASNAYEPGIGVSWTQAWIAR
ncbi:N-acetylglucosamine-binding protein GbpA [Pseudomonas mangiferae]|uniref:N-acetylglucosamine-binding protein GbpA n=1 Tax=Pseudomonas mangiferae TaxID=2593654 RepID=A0A553GTA5_9PSED|nr:N-acetylglucosamine-binding protein GbpA [Pseudomonas mangiferae]TRX72714.1 N-acetylglucosamine-binding protein GbpA [Pseudomonas mangiferae]